MKMVIQSHTSRFEVTLVDKKYNTEAYKRLVQGNPAYFAGGTGPNKLKF